MEVSICNHFSGSGGVRQPNNFRKEAILRSEDQRLKEQCRTLARKVHELATRVQVQRLRITSQEANLETKQGQLRTAREELTAVHGSSTQEAIRYAACMQRLLNEEWKVSEAAGLYYHCTSHLS